MKTLFEKVQHNIDIFKSPVLLNVGGETEGFAISKEKLLRIDGSLFYYLMASGNWKPDKKGEE